MRILRDAGLPPDEAVRAFRVLFVHVFGSAASYAPDPQPAERRAVHGAIVALPADDFPALRAVADQAGAALGGEKQFRYGVELIVDGLEARLAAPGR